MRAEVKERALRIPRRVERDGGNCCAVLQADGDPGCSPVVYVDRRGVDKSVDRYDGASNAEFSAEHGLQVCDDCKKYCEPVLTEHREGLFTESHFCYHCDFNGRVRMLVEDGLADVGTATRFVHRLIAFEHPGVGIDRVTLIR